MGNNGRAKWTHEETEDVNVAGFHIVGTIQPDDQLITIQGNGFTDSREFDYGGVRSLWEQ